MVRFVLYTGKGGVGKTSLAAATAVRCARRGARTLVLSTDAAHSLGDAFGQRIGPEPTRILPGLEALDVDVPHEIDAHWGILRDYVTRLLRSQGMTEIEAFEFAILPGMEELFSLLKLKEISQADLYDVAIIDCAPTGSTLQLLGLPDALRWYFERLYPMERELVRAVKPVAEKVLQVPLPDDGVYAAFERLVAQVEEVRKMLSDPSRTRMRLVLNPERMVIRETQRALSYLSLYGYPVDAAILNRVLPDDADGSFVTRWRDVQRTYLNEAEERFGVLKVLRAPLYAGEVVGIDALEKLALTVFGDLDPAERLSDGTPFEFVETDGRCELHIRLSGVDRGDLDLWVRGDELVIQVENVRRHVALPSHLARLPVDGARLEGDTFIVEFARALAGHHAEPPALRASRGSR